MPNLSLTFSPTEIESVRFECFGGIFKEMILVVKKPNKVEQEWGDGYERIRISIDPKFVEDTVLSVISCSTTLHAKNKGRGSKLWLSDKLV